MRPTGRREGYKVGQSPPARPPAFAATSTLLHPTTTTAAEGAGVEWRHASPE